MINPIENLIGCHKRNIFICGDIPLNYAETNFSEELFIFNKTYL